MQMKKKIFKVIIIILILAVSMGCAQTTVANVDELIRLGDNYLLELNFEQALVQFMRVIEIDPRNQRGYTGAAEAYIGLGMPEEAVAILERGLEMVDQEYLYILEYLLFQITIILLEQETLSINSNASFVHIGRTFEELTELLGAYSEMTQGESGTMFQFGNNFIAFDREIGGEDEGLAYVIITSLANLLGYVSRGAVSISALDALFDYTGESVFETRNYSYQGINIAIENIPSDGILPLQHTVVLSVSPRPLEVQQAPPTQLQTPAQPQTPVQLQTPEPPPPPPPPAEYIYEEYFIEIPRPQ